MASLLRIIFLRTLLFGMVASEDQRIITAESGHNITLTCRTSNNNKPIIVAEWSRADLQSEYVLLYRDEQFDPEEQHPSFKNRVDLQDRQMKDGDVSLILKNVMINDTGTYECRVVQREADSMKLISIIYLSVVAPPGHPRGLGEGGVSRGHLGLVAVVPFFVVIAALVIFIKLKGPPAEHQPV